MRGKGRDQHVVVKPYKGQWVVFPSPCGEKVGINKAYLAPPDFLARFGVSVPLRGKGRDQPTLAWAVLHAIRVRFRPLAGKR